MLPTIEQKPESPPAIDDDCFDNNVNLNVKSEFVKIEDRSNIKINVKETSFSYSEDFDNLDDSSEDEDFVCNICNIICKGKSFYIHNLSLVIEYLIGLLHDF